MFDQVPVRVWLLIAFAASAYVPARYVVRHWMQSPANREITQPPQDFGWRSSRRLIFNLAILAVLAVLSFAIFTPTAEQIARSPDFPSLLILLVGGFASFTVLRGLQIGRIEPLVRGFSETYERATQPKRFWVSVAWNGFLGLSFLGTGIHFLREAPKQALSAQCHDFQNVHAPRAEVTACDRLISDFKPEREELADIIAARGSAHYMAGDYRNALKDYNFALTHGFSTSSTWYNRGLVNEQLGEYSAALEDYSKSISADQDNDDAYVQRGVLYLNKGKIDAAIADFDRVLRRKPEDITARANRGLSYVWKGDVAGAQRDFAAVRANAPSNLVLLHGDAILSMRAGNTEAAIRLLTTALQVDPKDQWAFGARASAYRRLGDNAKAQADMAALTRLERAEYADHYPHD